MYIRSVGLLSLMMLVHREEMAMTMEPPVALALMKPPPRLMLLLAKLLAG